MPGNCSDQFPKTDEYYDNISGDVLTIVCVSVGCVFCVPTLAIYGEELRYIHRKFKKNDVTRLKLFTLLGLYPVMSVMSVFSLLVPTSNVICGLVMSCYLSVCIYIFVTMVIGYFGGCGRMVATLADDKFRLNTPPICCCLCCIKPRTMTSKALHYLKLCTLQVALVKPLLLFVQTVLWTDGKYDQGEINPDSVALYITIATVISTMTSIYGLIVIYQATRAHLAHRQIGMKFFSLKLAILAVNIQTVIFGIMARYDVPPCVGKMGPKVRGTIIRHAVLTIEAFLLALLARRAYRNDDYESVVSGQAGNQMDNGEKSPQTDNSHSIDKFCVENNDFADKMERNVLVAEGHDVDHNSYKVSSNLPASDDSGKQVNIQRL